MNKLLAMLLANILASAACTASAQHVPPLVSYQGPPVYVSSAGLNSDGTTVTEIHPDGTSSTVTVPPGPRKMVVAAAGTPNAGSVYVLHQSDSASSKPGFVSWIKADHSVQSITVGIEPADLVIGPPTAPNAGSVYVSNLTSHSITAISPDGHVVDIPMPTGASTARMPGAIAVAPGGTPNQGTIYVATDSQAPDGGGTRITAIAPEGTVSSYAVPRAIIQSLVVMPVGTPDAGLVYGAGSDRNSMSDCVIVRLPRTGRTVENVASVVGCDLLSTVLASVNSTATGWSLVAQSSDNVTAFIAANGAVHRLDPSKGPINEFATGIAPAGTANAGTLFYVRSGDLKAIDPSGSSDQNENIRGADLERVLVTRSGSGQRATVYAVRLTDAGTSSSVIVLRPDGTTVSVPVGVGPHEIAAA